MLTGAYFFSASQGAGSAQGLTGTRDGAAVSFAGPFDFYGALTTCDEIAGTGLLGFAIETPLTLVRTHSPSLEDAYLEIVGRPDE